MLENHYRFKEVEAGRFYVYETPEDIPGCWKRHRGKDYWEYRRQWNENALNNVAGDFPINIDLELTSRCNLRCRYCKRTSMYNGNRLVSGDMDWSLVTKVLDETAGRLQALKLNIRGEPLMYPKVAEAIDYAKKRGVVEVLMNTNGMLLTETMAERLLHAGLDTVIFSFDHVDKERFEAGRVGAKYETVVKNIRRMARLKREGGYQHVKIRANVFFDTDREKELAPLWNLFGGDLDEFTISKVNPTPDVTGIDLDACAEHFDDVAWICHQPWQRLGIFNDGGVIFCCTDFEGAMRVGNAREKSVHDLYHSHVVNTLRTYHFQRKGYKVPLCRSCHNFIYQIIKYYHEVLQQPYPVRPEKSRSVQRAC